jgi:hypothetical protein
VASFVGVGQLFGVENADEFSYIPRSAELVAFADLRQVVDSEIGQKLQAAVGVPSDSGPVLSEAGIDFRRDVDRIVAAGLEQASSGTGAGPLVLVRGRFDDSKIEAAVVARGGEVSQYLGTRIVATAEPPFALAFLEANLIAVGQLELLKIALDTKAAGSASVKDNPELMRLAGKVNDSNAWFVARFDAIQQRTPAPAGLVGQLPAITWLAASGRVDNSVSAKLHAEARDDKAAQDLQDVVRGLVSLARLQVGQQPDFAELVNSIELSAEGTTVSVSFTVPPATLEKLGTIGSRLRAGPTSGVSLQGVPSRAPSRRAPVI